MLYNILVNAMILMNFNFSVFYKGCMFFIGVFFADLTIIKL